MRWTIDTTDVTFDGKHHCTMLSYFGTETKLIVHFSENVASEYQSQVSNASVSHDKAQDVVSFSSSTYLKGYRTIIFNLKAAGPVDLRILKSEVSLGQFNGAHMTGTSITNTTTYNFTISNTTTTSNTNNSTVPSNSTTPTNTTSVTTSNTTTPPSSNPVAWSAIDTYAVISTVLGLSVSTLILFLTALAFLTNR